MRFLRQFFVLLFTSACEKTKPFGAKVRELCAVLVHFLPMPPAISVAH
jgi:hypothetical protein